MNRPVRKVVKRKFNSLMNFSAVCQRLELGHKFGRAPSYHDAHAWAFRPDKNPRPKTREAF